MTDVMWARPEGERVLLVATQAHADFITAVYRFDRVHVVPLEARRDGPELDVRAGDVALEMRAGPGWRVPLGELRPLWFTRWVEGPVARRLLGVRTFGTSPSGVLQWYRADEYRRLVEARAVVAGVDLGALRPIDVAVGFGFSGPPRQPSMVRLRSLLVDRSGRLQEALERGSVTSGPGGEASDGH